MFCCQAKEKIFPGAEFSCWMWEKKDKFRQDNYCTSFLICFQNATIITQNKINSFDVELTFTCQILRNHTRRHIALSSCESKSELFLYVTPASSSPCFSRASTASTAFCERFCSPALSLTITR